MKERTRTEYSIMNIFAGLGGYVINTVLGFVCRIIFVRYLASDYLGINGLFTNILSMLSLAELGVGSAVVFALYKPLAEHDEKKIVVLVSFYGKAYRVIGLVVAIIGMAMLPFLNLIIREQPNIQESIYVLYLINIFNTSSTYFFSYRSSLIIAAQQNYVVSGLNYIITTIQSVIQMVVLQQTRNYLLYLLIQTAGTFIYNVTISHIAVIKFPCIKEKDVESLDYEEKKSLFKNIRDLLIYKISGLLVNSTDNILITFFNGLSVAGIASNYTLLTSTLASLLSQVFNGLTASIGNHNAIESKERKYEMFSFLNMMNFWIYGWATIGIIFCSTDLVHLCFGEEYTLSMEIPIIIAVNFFTVGMMNAIWTYKHTMGLFRFGRFLQFGTGILNIFLSIVFGKQWGLFGILVATFVARLLTNLWYDPFAIYKYGFEENPMIYLRKYIIDIIILGVAAILCFVTFKYIKGSIIYQVIAKIILCSLITNAVFFIAFFKTPEFVKLKIFMRSVKNIVGNKMKKLI